MEKCIFVGYPEGYKAWRFYNPNTRKVIISERAEFDERYFPGLTMDSRLLPAYTRQKTPSVEHSKFEGVNIVPNESAEELEIPHATEFKAVQP